MRFRENVREFSERIISVLHMLIRRIASIKERLFQDPGKTEKPQSPNPNEQNTVNGERGDLPEEPVKLRKILVSYCLYGEKKVRYDGREIPLTDEIFLQWKKEERLIPVCPEVDGGLPVPRLPSERSGKKVLGLDGRDVTNEYMKGAIHALRLARESEVAFAIMKEGSPSCGSSYINDGNFTGRKKHGEGVAVEKLRNAGISVFSEKELQEAAEYLAELEAEDPFDDHDQDTITIRSGIMRGTVK